MPSRASCTATRRPRHAHLNRRGKNVCGHAAGINSTHDCTTLLLTIAGERPRLKLPLEEAAMPDSRPVTALLHDWKVQFEPGAKVIPYAFTTDTGRKACEAPACWTTNRQTTKGFYRPPEWERKAPAPWHMTCNTEWAIPAGRRVRPQSAPPGQACTISPAKSEAAVSESSIFLGGLPKVVKIDYEKLHHKFSKSLPKASLDADSQTPPSFAAAAVAPSTHRRPQSAVAGRAVAPEQKEEETQMPRKPRPKSAVAAKTTSSAILGATQIGTQEICQSSEPRPRQRKASASFLRIGFGGPDIAVDPYFLSDILGKQMDAKVGGHIKKAAEVAAKANAMVF